MHKRQSTKCSSMINCKQPLLNNQLDLSEKNITELDQIPITITNNVYSLKLAGNRIQELGGIRQFQQLQYLDLRNNKIKKGTELRYLQQMGKLKKVLLDGNPFLLEPIDTSIIDMLTKYNTDINLPEDHYCQSSREQQNEENHYSKYNSIETIQKEENNEILRFSFIQHYFKKMALHQEMHTNNLLKTLPICSNANQVMNKLRLFYSKQTNQSEHHRKKIKENKAKKDQEQHINILVKDIVTLLQQNDSFADQKNFLLQVDLQQNTLNFSPQKHNTCAEHETTPIINVSEQQKYSKHISLKHKQQFNQQKSMFQRKSNTMDFLQTIKRPFEYLSMQKNTNKNNKQVIKNQSLIKNSFERLNGSTRLASNDNLLSQKSNNSPINLINKSLLVTPLKKNENKSALFIKVQEDDEIPKSSKVQKFEQNKTFVLNNSTEHLESMYYTSIKKINPMFSLLLSPLNSLSKQEAIELLKALSIDHKQKAFELVREKKLKQQLRFEMEEANRKKTKQIEYQTQQQQKQRQKLNAKIEEVKWAHDRIKSYRNQLLQLKQKTDLITKELQSQTSQIVLLSQENFSLNSILRSKINVEKKQQKQDQIQQIVATKRLLFIKKKYLKLIQKKGKQWNTVFLFKNKRQMKWIKNIYQKIFEKLKKQLHIKHLKNAQQKQKDANICKKYFNYLKDCRTVSQKHVQVIRYILNTQTKILIHNLKIKQAENKIYKLKNIWAHRHFAQHQTKKHFLIFKSALNETKQKQDTVNKFYLKNILALKFKKFVQSVQQTKINIQDKEKKILETISIKKKLLFFSSLKKQFQLIQFKKNDICQMLKQKLYSKLFQNVCFLKNNEQAISKNYKSLITFLQHKHCKKLFYRLKKQQILKVKFIQFIISYKQKCQQNNVKCLKKQNIIFKKQKIKFDHQFLNKLKSNYRRREINKLKSILFKNLKNSIQKIKKISFLNQLRIYNNKKKRRFAIVTMQKLQENLHIIQNKQCEKLQQFEDELIKRQTEIQFLKGQIQRQSQRESIVLRQKEDLLIRLYESQVTMSELRTKNFGLQSKCDYQDLRYSKLADVYSESINMSEYKGQTDWNNLAQSKQYICASFDMK